MSSATASYRSSLTAGGDGWLQLIRSEWTKFRTVRGWVIAAICAGISILLLGWLATSHHNSGGTCVGPGNCSNAIAHPHVAIGPGGEAVNDTYYFVHRTLTGNGTLTARVGSMSGRVQGGNGNAVSVGDLVGAPGPLSPWAKAGLIITQSARPGAPYAAVMLTGAHGVRLQYDYTGDVAGSLTPASGARWLRLTRTGTTVTGYESADGAHWTELGTVRLPGLRASVRAGLFVTSPQSAVLAQQYLAPNSVSPKATGALARFDRITTAGGWSGGAWSGADFGANAQTLTLSAVGYHRSSDGGFQISGSGDIGPAVGLPASFTVQPSLTGVFIGLIVLVVLGVMFITVEYRRGLIQTTLVATPRRGRVLAAKALVIAAVTFVVGAAACAVAIPLGAHLLRSTGNFVYPISTLTRLRVIAGVGALLAVAAVLALAVGTMIRRSAGAVVAVIVAIVLPYILSATAAVPDAVAQWLMRLSPAAAFAVEQTIPHYHQVDYLYAPSQGFYPLSPGAGLLVLCAYAALALALATRLLNSRDA